MRASTLAVTVALLLLFGITALAGVPQTPTNTPSPTPSAQDSLHPQGTTGADQNDQGEMDVDAESGDTQADDPEAGDKESGDTQSGDSQSGAQQEGEFEGDN